MDDPGPIFHGNYWAAAGIWCLVLCCNFLNFGPMEEYHARYLLAHETRWWRWSNWTLALLFFVIGCGLIFIPETS
jgi:threonine/homoserine/homoserine lactone efflux protein